MRRLAWLLDDSIRLPCGYRIGIDGLISGLGNAGGLAASTWILVRARRFRVPRVVMARMIGNVLLESVIGVIPVVGDLFDFAFKVNRRNIGLMERYLVDERQVRRESRVRISVAFAAGLAVIALVPFLLFASFAVTRLSACRWDDSDSVSVAVVGAFADPSFPAPEVSVYDSRRHPWV